MHLYGFSDLVFILTLDRSCWFFFFEAKVRALLIGKQWVSSEKWRRSGSPGKHNLTTEHNRPVLLQIKLT